MPKVQAILEKPKGTEGGGKISAIDLTKIRPDPKQPRRTFDEYELGSLAESMREVGQLQAAQVSGPDAQGIYTLVFGERRWRAAKIAGLKTLRCEIVNHCTDAEITIRQLVENMQRSEVSPMQEAIAFSKYLMAHGKRAGELAIALGVTSSRVSKSIALTRLDPDVQVMISEGDISAAAGYELSRIKDHTNQHDLAMKAANGGWSRDRLSKEVDEILITATQKAMPIVDQIETSEVYVDVPTAMEETPESQSPVDSGPGSVAQQSTKGFPGETSADVPESPVTPAWSRERRFRFAPHAGCVVTVNLPAHTIDVKQAVADAFEHVLQYWDDYRMDEDMKKDRGLPPGR